MRELPSDNLAYPVLITLNTGSMGTGVFLSHDGVCYLATAKHNFFDLKNNTLKGTSATLKSYTQNWLESDYTEITIDLNILSSNSNIKYHNSHDICLIKIQKDIVFDGVEILKISSTGIVGINFNSTAKPYNDVLISNDIFIFGYPASIGLKNSPQFNMLMPLLRKGIVAGKNNSNSTIIIDCPIYQGNSGGPVIEVERIDATKTQYKLIGIVVQFIPVEEKWQNLSFGLINIDWSNSGYAVIEPIDFIRDVLVQF